MRNLRIGAAGARTAAVAGAAALTALIAAPFASAVAAGYASWNFATTNVVVPAADFPTTHITTNSVNPSSPSGQSAFLNASTPFGQVFGSSQGKPYALLRLAQNRQPSTTVISFDQPPAPGTWGLALGDVDAESVMVQAYDANGTLLPTSALGFQSTFNFCQGSPLPSTCGGTQGTDMPVWNPGTSTLVGNVVDTNGASGWFRPSAAVSSLVLTATLNQGIPAYQVWLAAEDQPKSVASEPHPDVVPTDPGQPVKIQVCSAPGSDIDVVSGPENGTISSHEDCSVTYTPRKGYQGHDAFTLRVVLPDGKVLVKSYDIVVQPMLAATGVATDLVGEIMVALALMGLGTVLTVATLRAERAYWSGAGDTMDS